MLFPSVTVLVKKRTSWKVKEQRGRTVPPQGQVLPLAPRINDAGLGLQLSKFTKRWTKRDTCFAQRSSKSLFCQLQLYLIPNNSLPRKVWLPLREADLEVVLTSP